MRLAEIWIYPVKSCRGLSLPHATVTETGIEHDRIWMVIDEHGEFVTQREHPRLALIETGIVGPWLCLRAPDRGEVRVPLRPEAPARRPARIWGHGLSAEDAGDDAAQLLTEHLGSPCRLVRMPDDHERPVGSAFAGRARTAFTDGYPLLAISTASLEALNRRLTTPVPMDRFRPNLVVVGGEAHAEDTWSTVRVGEVEFAACKLCPRCVVTTVDQRSATRGREPLQTLAEYRKQPDGVMFGQNLVHLGRGRLSVGDAIEAR